MRVSNNMISSFLLKNITSSSERMAKYEGQLSSQKIFSHPSDNPMAVNQAINFRVSLKEIDQYLKNVDDGKSLLDCADSAFMNANDLLQRAKQLAVKGANETNTQDQQYAIAKEVDGLLEGMISIGNSTFAGKYIFGGFVTTSPPFEADGSPAGYVNYVGDTGSVNYETEKGITISTNLNGEQVFTSPTDVFQSLIDLRDHLLAGDSGAVSQDTSKVDDALNMITNAQMDVGSRTNRMNMTKDRLNQIKIDLSKSLSGVEDVDIAEVTIKLKTEQTAYTVALSTSGMIMQKSLMDFLR